MEWIAIVLLVALALVATLALALPGSAGTAIARAVGERIVCAASLGKLACRAEDSALAVAYGGEAAELLRKHAPRIMYEQGATNVPVDFRDCRSDECARGRPGGGVTRSRAGHPAVLFTRVIDCREGAEREPGVDCTGGRSGSLYLQYWAYFPSSDTWGDDRPISRAIKAAGGAARGENPGFHPDDWESLQIRVRPDGAVDARASSHHGYNHRHGSMRNWLSDAGIRARPGWGPASGRYYLTWGSNAGGVVAGAPGLPSRFGGRHTPRWRVVLRPLEAVAGPHAETRFAVTPPWRKAVFNDPEATGT